MRLQLIALVAVAVAAIAAAPTPPAAAALAQEEAQVVDERYTAYAISMGNIATGRRSRVQINITRWTTDEERGTLAEQLVSGGNEALRNAFDKTAEVGRIRVGTRLSYPLYYAREFELETGIRRIVLATNRPISFLEGVANPRTRDYDISLIILDLEHDGTGSGIAGVGVQFGVNRETGVLTIENYGTEPVRITNLRRDD